MLPIMQFSNKSNPNSSLCQAFVVRCSGHGLYGHGKAKPRRVLHGWMRGKRVYLLLARRRWRCEGCGHSFTEGASLVRPYSRMSRQAEGEALYELREHSFSQVGKEAGGELQHAASAPREGCKL